MKTVVAPLIALVAGLVIAACGVSKAPARVLAPLPNLGPPVSLEDSYLVPGEVLRYEVSLHGIIGAEASIASGKPGLFDGRQVLITKSRTETVGLAASFREVDDEVTTWIDVESGVPLYYYADLKFGAKESVVRSRFGRGPIAIAYQRKGKPARTLRHRLPQHVQAHDTHSAIALLRGWRGQPGARAYFYVLAGRRVWRSDVRMMRSEEIETPLGKQRALRIDGIAHRMTRGDRVDRRKKPRRFSVWIADDQDRKPLRVSAHTEYGRVAVSLVHYERPPTRISRR